MPALTNPLVNVKSFGAIGDGVTDDTAALQNALNYVGANGGTWYVPDGRFNFTSLLMPTTTNITYAGNGVSSVLVQKGAGISWPSLPTNCYVLNQTVRDLSFDGTVGTGNSLDTSYTSSIDLINLFFNNIPVGFSSLHIDGNPNASGTYSHDVRAFNIRGYSTTTGHSLVRLGSKSSDGLITGLICNLNFAGNYCVYADANAQTWAISDSHPYNAKLNIVNCANNNSDFTWTSVIFDNALSDLIYMNACNNHRFTACWFEAAASGTAQVTLNNCVGNNFSNCSFIDYSSGLVSAVRETGGSKNTAILMGQIAQITNYVNPFNLTGAGSFARGFENYAPFGALVSLSGVSSSIQSQNTTTNYGPAGQNASLHNASWNVPFNGQLVSAFIATDATPTAGQTFTFNVQDDGTTVTGGTLTVAHGSFGGLLTFNPPIQVAQGTILSIQSIFSATSGSSNVRYNLNIQY